jgi:hypothetical protein
MFLGADQRTSCSSGGYVDFGGEFHFQGQIAAATERCVYSAEIPQVLLKRYFRQPLACPRGLLIAR